jgi:hypothetical protein
MSDEDGAISGVLGGSPAALFENLDEAERDFEASNPFPDVVRRGGSRKGRPNRRNEDVRRYFAGCGFRDPLLFLGHLYSIDTDELARHLGCERADALDIQRKAAVDVLPYMHSRQPTAVTVSAEAGTPMLVVGAADQQLVADQVAAGAMSIDGPLRRVENQGVAASGDAGSHGEGSHGAAKGAAEQGDSAIQAAD